MPLHVLIAPDKFKGTLTAREAAAAIAGMLEHNVPSIRAELTEFANRTGVAL